VRARDKVGIVLPRSSALIVGLLAIMKTGAIYVPADPIYPTERIDYMFGNSEITCVISQNDMELPSGYIRYDIHELEKEEAVEQTIEDEQLNPNKDWVKISISDNGPGIPEEMQEKVFVPNFTTKNTGAGLGMPISKNIVEGSGGKICFQTSEKGTTFFVYLRKK
jgi:signal transduction histidine kinase